VYDVDLPNADSRVNTATVEIENENGSTPEWSDTADVNFASATMTEVDESVTLDDDKYNVDLGTILASEAPKTFNYTMNVGPYDDIEFCGTFQDFVNTATITLVDSGTTQDDSHTVTSEITCVCSLTQGYWKTHNEPFKGGAPEDDNWDNVPDSEYDANLTQDGPHETFFKSGTTWFNVFWTAPKGNVYYNLAHQYMAAKLNVLNGAIGPATVVNAIATAEARFNTYTPAEIAAMKGKNKTAISAEFTALAGILGAFNEGLTNPAGHCSEIPL
jgi:hypothetical protein